MDKTTASVDTKNLWCPQICKTNRKQNPKMFYAKTFKDLASESQHIQAKISKLDALKLAQCPCSHSFRFVTNTKIDYSFLGLSGCGSSWFILIIWICAMFFLLCYSSVNLTQLLPLFFFCGFSSVTCGTRKRRFILIFFAFSTSRCATLQFLFLHGQWPQNALQKHSLNSSSW